MDDGTFPALLKTLSDSSEEVRIDFEPVDYLWLYLTSDLTSDQ